MTAASILAMLSKGRLLLLSHPIHPEPRYGHGRPPHWKLFEMFEGRRESFHRQLTGVLDFKNELAAISIDANPSSPEDPHWNNGWFPGLDLAVLYATLGRERPRTYLEVGSGNSTKVARRAIRDLQLETKLLSIDPNPRAACDSLCDTVVRCSLEQCDLAIFDQLGAGDVLFVDSSHFVFMNSDVTILFLEILPYLPVGVLVHFHDIWLPYDYPHRWKHWYFAEQYLLANSLLVAPDRYEIKMANRFVIDDPELSQVLTPLWDMPPLQRVQRQGGSFWIIT